jgi:glycosyltransferase involved in cell wall biosynthesis
VSKPSLRLTFILSSLWLSGGMRVIVEYANRLTARGHTVTLVCPGGTWDADMATEVAPEVTLVASQVERTEGMGRADYLRLSQSLANAVPVSDFVFSTHTPTTVAGWMATALQRKGRPLWLFQDYRAMFDGRPVEQWLMDNALRWHEMAFVISVWAGQELPQTQPEKISVIGEGLSHAELFTPRYFAARARLPERTLLYLGDERPRKGLREFLDAAALVHAQGSNLRLQIVSKETCRVETPLPFTYVHRPPVAALAEMYRTCDVYVASSWSESLGIPPLEAMACAAPVVLADAGGTRDYAEPGVNCLQVPPRNAPALAEAILTVLRDDALAQRLSHAGPPTAARYDWETLTDRWEETLLRLHTTARHIAPRHTGQQNNQGNDR